MTSWEDGVCGSSLASAGKGVWSEGLGSANERTLLAAVAEGSGGWNRRSSRVLDRTAICSLRWSRSRSTKIERGGCSRASRIPWSCPMRKARSAGVLDSTKKGSQRRRSILLMKGVLQETQATGFFARRRVFSARPLGEADVERTGRKAKGQGHRCRPCRLFCRRWRLGSVGWRPEEGGSPRGERKAKPRP